MTRRQLSSTRTEVGTVSGPLAEQERLKEKAKEEPLDVQYGPDGAEGKVMQLEGRLWLLRR